VQTIINLNWNILARLLLREVEKKGEIPGWVKGKEMAIQGIST